MARQIPSIMNYNKIRKFKNMKFKYTNIKNNSFRGTGPDALVLNDP